MKNVWFFFVVFEEILQKFRDFVNSDDCIGKSSSNSIRLQPVVFEKRLESNKKKILVKN